MRVVAKGLILAKNPALLAENGGTLTFSHDWARSFLRRHGYTLRRACTMKRGVVCKEKDDESTLKFETLYAILFLPSFVPLLCLASFSICFLRMFLLLYIV